jgi:hypothetical protein
LEARQEEEESVVGVRFFISESESYSHYFADNVNEFGIVAQIDIGVM